jgi:hypothetical protein
MPEETQAEARERITEMVLGAEEKVERMVRVGPNHIVPEKYMTPAEREMLGLPPKSLTPQEKREAVGLPPKGKMTARDVREALEARYEKGSQGKPNEKWILLHEARAGAGFGGNDGSCDLIAINTWPSQGLQIIGHEIKVSYSDWQNELTNEGKAERFAMHCHRWWVVAPAELAKRIQHELPGPWGLISVLDSGKTREVVTAPRREPKPLPTWWWIAWMAQLDRKEKRELSTRVERQIRERVEAEVKRATPRQSVDTMTAQDVLDLQNLRAWKERVDEFEREFGINIHKPWGADYKRLGTLWKSRLAPQSPLVARQLRELAAALEGLFDGDS